MTAKTYDAELVDIIFARLSGVASKWQFFRHTKQITADGFVRNEKYLLPNVLELYDRFDKDDGVLHVRIEPTRKFWQLTLCCLHAASKFRCAATRLRRLSV